MARVREDEEKKEEMSKQKMPANLVKGGLPSSPPTQETHSYHKVKLHAGDWARAE